MNSSNVKTPKELRKLPNRSEEKLNLSVDVHIKKKQKILSLDEKLNFSDNEISAKKRQNKSEFDINLKNINGAIDESNLVEKSKDLLEISEEKYEQSGSALSSMSPSQID